MRHLEELGWYVTRAYASRGPWDLLAMHRDRAPLMIQVKATEQAYMLPEERAALITMADRAGAMPVACACPHPYSSTLEGLRYWVLEVGASRILMDP